MIFGTIVYQQLSWLVPAIAIMVLFVVTLIWAYYNAAAGGAVRAICFLVKLAGFGLLAYCLLEPMSSKMQPRQGANLMLLVADDSQSMSITDAQADDSRGQTLKQQLTDKTTWQTRIEQDFDVRRFSFDTRVKRISDFESLSFGGRGSSIAATLDTLRKRFENRPVAGIVLFTDGNSTDSYANDIDEGSFDLSDLPPIYPVSIGSENVSNDIAISNVNVRQSNFEAAPVTVNAQIQFNSANSDENENHRVVAELLGNTGETIERQEIEIDSARTSKDIRFQFQPLNPGVDSYQLVVASETEFDEVKNGRTKASQTDHTEPTLANNKQHVVVNRKRGPFRVLYVSGRPNWEYKYLQRAISEDEEVKLVGLIRIAKKEPKFDFRSRIGESTNPLFRGFGEDGETSEQYDEPVLIRLGEFEEGELSDGFPKTEDELFPYHAVILDDVEAGFFRQDQMQLLKTFVSRRGGGLMMLGGTESFRAGGYRRTPIADLLPVYLDQSRRSENSVPLVLEPSEAEFFAPVDELREMRVPRFVFDLSRDGWLSPWMRLRRTEDEEKVRLTEMANFATANEVGRVKPGAETLATISGATGEKIPAVAAQSFGRGRTVAMSVGDFWRWGMERESTEAHDLGPAWRQTVRWLISDVPSRVDCVLLANDSSESITTLKTTVLNEKFLPQDNAGVEIVITRPDNSEIRLTAQTSASEAGVYATDFVSAETGSYRAKVIAKSADGTKIGETETGWVYQPSQNEFASMKTNREFLERLAKASGGEVIEPDGLDKFVRTFNDREIPIMEKKITPLWHRWYFFLIAIGLLMFEWGLRRVKGLP